MIQNCNLHSHLKKKYSDGFGLIEVLISLLIMGIATLGYIQFQISLQRTEYDTNVRQVALMLVQDMAGRIQGNRNNALLGVNSAYNGGTHANGIYNSNCIGGGNLTCYNDQLAKFDLWEWGQYIMILMPPGTTGSVKVNNSNYHTITLNWTHPQYGPENITFTVVP